MKIACISMNLDWKGMAGSYRPLKFIKYMLRAGHTVVAISATDIDSELSKYTGDRLQHIIVPYNQANNLPQRFIRRMTCFPDPSKVWAEAVYNTAKKLFTSEKPDVILISTPPHSVQIAGIRLSRDFNIPYIADLRDDWLTNSRMRWRTPLHKIMARKCEGQIVANAARIVLNTDVVLERFKRRYPESIHKLHFLPNGYDEDDFNVTGQKEMVDLPAKNILTYLGSGYSGFMNRQLSDIALQLRSCGLDKFWHIVTAGPDIVAPMELRNVWTYTGMLPHHIMTALMCRSDLLLLVMPPGEEEPSGTVPLKAYQYLRSGKAIIYIGERGATTDLLAKFPGTYAFSRNHWRYFAEWLSQEAPILAKQYVRARIEQYSFEYLTAVLCGIITTKGDGFL